MKFADIYQTLEDRNNDDEVRGHGPFFCSFNEDDGSRKPKGKEPWLGEGYYFWDTFIEDAKWLGDTVYRQRGKNYIVCKTQFNLHSQYLLDLFGDLAAFREFLACAELVREQTKKNTVTFAYVLTFMKKDKDFPYKAIRVWPNNGINEKTFVNFENTQYSLGKIKKVQICFFDKTLFVYPLQIVFKRNNA